MNYAYKLLRYARFNCSEVIELMKDRLMHITNVKSVESAIKAREKSYFEE